MCDLRGREGDLFCNGAGGVIVETPVFALEGSSNPGEEGRVRAVGLAETVGAI